MVKLRNLEELTPFPLTTALFTEQGNPVRASQAVLVVENPPAGAGGIGDDPGQEDPLEEGVAPHSSVLAWRIPWTEEPGRLQSMGSQRIRGD